MGNPFQGQRVALVFEQVKTSTVLARWKLTQPFQVPSTTSHYPSWSLLAHPPPKSHAKHIHNIIYIHRPFIQRSVKSNIHIFEFAIVLGHYSYFYRLRETGCYNTTYGDQFSCKLDI
jgi:hypothetical protein